MEGKEKLNDAYHNPERARLAFGEDAVEGNERVNDGNPNARPKSTGPGLGSDIRWVKPDAPQPTVRVARITIGRLHNLGNYEHIRYEVSLELAHGAKAGDLLGHLEGVLADLQPKSPVSEWELHHAQNDYRESLDNGNLEQRTRAVRIIMRHKEWLEKRQHAKDLLNTYGGTQVYTDAKETWDEEDRL